MKKVFLTLLLFAGLSLTASPLSITSDCGPNASAISSSCWSGCVSVTPRVTGNLPVDIANVIAGPRKPTAAEYAVAQEILDDMCNNIQ